MFRDVRDISDSTTHVIVIRFGETHISQVSSLAIKCAHVAKVLLQECARVAKMQKCAVLRETGKRQGYMHLAGSGSQQPFDVKDAKSRLDDMWLDAWHFVLTMRNETICRRLLARLSNEASNRCDFRRGLVPPSPYVVTASEGILPYFTLARSGLVRATKGH